MTQTHSRITWTPLVQAALVAGYLTGVGACGPAPAGQSVRFTDTPPAAAAPEAAPLTPTPTVPAATPTPACDEPTGRVETLTYPGVVVDQAIPLRLYLPPCYDREGRAYPTAYLLHGKPYDETHWQDLGVVAFADQGISQGAWPPFLLVLPLQPEPIFSNSDGGPWSYEEELVDGLVPYVDGAFRTVARPEGRALAGISRGGIWALEVGFSNPSLFGSVAAFSPALAVNHPRPEYDPFEIVRQPLALPPNILLLAGLDDWARPETERLSRTLADAGWDQTLVLVPGGHEDATWQSALVPLLEFLSAAWVDGAPSDGAVAPSIP